MQRASAVLRHLAPPSAASVRRATVQSPLCRIAPSSFSSSSLLHGVPCAAYSSKSLQAPLLPPQSEADKGRLTVCVDMDETLLHSFLSPLPPPTASRDPRSVDDHEDQVAAHIPPEQRRPVDFEFEIGVGREKERVRSTLRPGLREFMHALSAEFEPILFTSAMQVYAEPLLNRIDLPPSSPDTEAATPAHLHPLWRHRIYRPGTVSLPGGWSYVKDISRLGRSMKRCVLVDNSWMACVANPDNAIVVPDYLGHKDDRVLEAVLAVLRQLKDEADVRPALIKQFALREQLTKARVKLPNPSIEEQE